MLRDAADWKAADRGHQAVLELEVDVILCDGVMFPLVAAAAHDEAPPRLLHIANNMNGPKARREDKHIKRRTHNK